MRPLTRFLSALVLVIAPLAMRAQDPAPAPEPAPEIVSTLETTTAPEANPTAMGPDDGPPANDPDLDALVAAATSGADGATPAEPPSGGSAEPVSAPADAVPPRPPVPSVDVAVGALDTVAEVRSGGARNWVFLAILGVAAVVIVAKISREKSERVSIHEP